MTKDITPEMRQKAINNLHSILNNCHLKSYQNKMLAKAKEIENDGHKHIPIKLMDFKVCKICGKDL